MPTVRIQEKNYSESIMVLKPKDGAPRTAERSGFPPREKMSGL